MTVAKEELRAPHASTRAAPRARAGALRLDLPLAAIVLLAFALSAYYTSHVTNWLVMSDELQHSKLGLNIGRELTLVPHLHGQVYSVYTMLYPLVTAPLYQLFGMPDAFRAVHVLNSALMASTAIPAYLLALDVLRSKWAARVAAALTVAVPWMALSTMVLTENAAYPAFTWTLLAMYRSIVAPSVRNDLLSVAAIIVAFFARTQFAVLVAVFPLAILVHEIGFAAMAPGSAQTRLAAVRGALARMAREHRALLVVAAIVALIAIPLALTGSVGAVLGVYETTTRTDEGSLLPPGMAESAALHLAYVAVGCSLLSFPLALAWSGSTVLRPTSRRLHGFAVLGLGTSISLTLVVASFALRFTNGGVSDRYLFYIAPVLFIGMLAYFTDARRRWISLLVASVVAATIVNVAGFLPSGGPFFNTPASAFHQVIYGQSDRLAKLLGLSTAPNDLMTLIAVLAGVGIAALGFRVPSRTLGLVVGAVVLVAAVAQTQYVFNHMTFGANGSRSAAVAGTLEGRDWIDARVGSGSSVGMLPSQEGTSPVQGLWWETEFWNKSVDRTLRYQGATTYTPFPVEDVQLDKRTGAMTVSAARRPSYVVSSKSETRFGIGGRSITEHPVGLVLQEPAVPWRATWVSEGVQPHDGMLIDNRGSLRIFGRPTAAKRVGVEVTIANAGVAPRTRRFAVTAGAGSRVSGAVPAAKQRRITSTLCVPANGFREIGLHFRDSSPYGAAPGIEPILVGLRLAGVRVMDRGTCRA
jgi:hypothetical protein